MTRSWAQPATKVPIVGILGGQSRAGGFDLRYPSFLKGLREHGYVVDRNLRTEIRLTDGEFEQLPQMAADLLKLDLSVLVAVGAVAGIKAAQRATTVIPIVFVVAGDPVRLGLVRSLGAPGGNTTGATMILNNLAEKRLELLRELVPTAKKLGFLVRPDAANAVAEAKRLQPLAKAMGYLTHVFEVRNDTQIERAFAEANRISIDAILVIPESYLFSRRKRLATLAQKYRLPAIYGHRDFVSDGGLIGYGASINQAYLEAGRYTARILKGADPATLPVVQTRRFELAINLKTAKQLGIEISPQLLVRADVIIE